MNALLLKKSHGVVKISLNEILFTGICTVGKQNSRELSIFSGLKKEQGWIVSDTSITSWNFTGITAIKDQVYYYGTFLDGVLLADLLEGPSVKSLTFLLKLVRALSMLKAKGHLHERIYTNGIIFLNNGETAFLPYPFMKELDRIQNVADHLSCCELFNHPEKKGEDNISFSIAVMVYKIITGKLPFFGETEEDIHERIRTLVFLPPKLKNFTLKNSVSDLIVDVLKNKSPDRSFLLDEWIKFLEVWISEGVLTTISQEEEQHLAAEAARLTRKKETRFNRQGYLFRNRAKLIVAALTAAALLWAGIGITRNLLAPPVTFGMSPLEVVRLFYDSINTMDSSALEDCLDKKVDTAEVKETLTLYVITKVRSVYGDADTFLTAQDWVDKGRPPLKKNQLVYGIASLSIQEENPGVFLTKYEKWQPGETSDPESDIPSIQGIYNTDMLYLRDTGEYWVISDIKRIKTVPLTVESSISPLIE